MSARVSGGTLADIVFLTNRAAFAGPATVLLWYGRTALGYDLQIRLAFRSYRQERPQSQLS